MSTVLTVAKAWRSELGIIAVICLSSVSSVAISSYFPFLVFNGPLIDFGSQSLVLDLPLSWLAPAFFSLVLLYRVFNVKYTLNESCIESRVGVLGFNQQISRIRYEDIISIEIDQNLISRILNFSDVKLGTAGTAEVEVTLAGVCHPLTLRTFIQAERDKRQKVQSSVVKLQHEFESGAAAKKNETRLGGIK